MREVEKVVAHLKAQGKPAYLEDVTADDEGEEDAEAEDLPAFEEGELGEPREPTSTIRRFDRPPASESLDLLHPAAASDRVQSSGVADGAHGEGGCRRTGQPRRKARNPDWVRLTRSLRPDAPGRARLLDSAAIGQVKIPAPPMLIRVCFLAPSLTDYGRQPRMRVDHENRVGAAQILPGASLDLP